MTPNSRYIRSRLPASIARSRLVARLLLDERAIDRSSAALSALVALGPQAQPAMPELVRMLNKTNSVHSCAQATAVLVGLGSDGIPALTAATTPENPNRETVLHTISYLAANSTTAKAWATVAPTIPTMASNALYGIAPERLTNALFRAFD